MHKSKKTRLSKTWMDGEGKEPNQKCNSQQEQRARQEWMDAGRNNFPNSVFDSL